MWQSRRAAFERSQPRSSLFRGASGAGWPLVRRRLLLLRLVVVIVVIAAALRAALLAAVAVAATLRRDARPLAFAGKVFAAASFQLVYVLTSDAFPAAIRSTAFGICSSCARVASISVPTLAGKLSLGAASMVSSALALAAAAAAHGLGRLGEGS